MLFLRINIVFVQGSDEASIDPVTSVRSDLAVWSAGAFICWHGLSVHHTQCFSGNTRHLYYVHT